MKTILVILFMALILMHTGIGQDNLKTWCYQLQDFDPTTAPKGCMVYVIDYSRTGGDDGMYTREELESLREDGALVYAYLSIGEAEDYRFYWNDSWYIDPPAWLDEENPDWPGNYLVKYWMQGWRDILAEYISRIVSQGFDGVYLDKIDSYYTWSLKGMDIEVAAEYMADLIIWVESQLPSHMHVIPQNGEDILLYRPDLLDHVDGWAVEDLFYNELTPQPEDEVAWRLQFLEMVREAGKKVYVIDYVYDQGVTPETYIFHFTARIHGYIPYAGDRDRALDELIAIPGLQPYTDPLKLAEEIYRLLTGWSGVEEVYSGG